MKKLLAMLLTLTLVLLPIMTLAAEAAEATDSAQFAADFEAADTTRPKMRVWWESLDMTDEQIYSDVQAIAEAGYGAIELNWGDMDDPAYLHVFEVYCAAAEEYGIEMDKKYSAGAPATMSATDDADYNYEITAKSLSYAVRQLTDEDFEDGVFVGEIPGYGDVSELEQYSTHFDNDNTATAETVEGTDNDAATEEEDSATVEELAIVVVKLIADSTREDVARALSNPTQPQYDLGTLMEVAVTVQMIDQDSMMLLEEGETFTLPEGDVAEEYAVFAFYVVCEDQGESISLDQYSAEATLATMEHWKETNWSDSTAAFFEKYGCDLFDDSNEDRTDLPWTIGYAELFEETYGYSLLEYLPLLINRFVQPSTITSMGESLRYGFEDGSDSRVFSDYQDLLSTLYLENHVVAATEWCEELGITFRVQAYQGTEGEDSYFDATTNSYYAGIMEGESLAFMEGRDGYNSWRYLTAGMHLADKQILSNELGAVFGIGITYSQTYEDLMTLVNKNAIAGSNEFIIHGYTCYDSTNSSGSSWPGYHEFGIIFTEHWTQNQPGWSEMTQMTDYMARIQQITQAGTALYDVVFYRDINNTKFDDIDDTLLTSYGFNYDFISPELLALEEASVEDGLLDASGSAYKALIIDNQDGINVDTAEILLADAQAGLPIIIVGDVPSTVKTYAGGDYAGEDAELAAIMEELVATEGVYQVEAQEDIAPKLLEIGITPYVDYSDNANEAVMCLTRVDSTTYTDTISYNLFYNPTDADATIEVTLNGSGTPYLLGLFDGTVKAIENAGTTLTLTIEAGDMVAIAVSEGALSEDTVDLNYTLGTETDLSAMDWSMVIDSYTSGSDTDPNVTDITTLDAVVGPLTLWKDIEGLEAVSGNAVYTLTFDYAPSGSGTILSMEAGDGTMIISHITVNGTELSNLNQFTKSIDLGALLVEGENTIEIKLSSSLENAYNFNTSESLNGAEYGLTSVVLCDYE